MLESIGDKARGPHGGTEVAGSRIEVGVVEQHREAPLQLKPKESFQCKNARSEYLEVKLCVFFKQHKQ